VAKAVIEIPDECLQDLEAYRDRIGELLLLGLTQARLREILDRYEQGAISFGRAAQLAGISQRDLVRQARALGISPTWDEGMLAEELG